MLALKPFAEAHGRSMVQAQAIPSVRLLALHGFSTHQLARMLHSSVRVSRRVGWKPSASIFRARIPKDKAPFMPWSARQQRPGIKTGVCTVRPTHADQRPARAAPRWRRVSLGAHTASNRFPLDNFKHFLTLFSKSFSSFHHCTCSLSVSRQYLALDGIYHPIGAAFSNNPTRGKRLVRHRNVDRRGSHPLRRRLPADLGPARYRGRFYRLQFSRGRFSSWAIPGSLAVTRGILVSFFSSAY
jgi:hypothetical protein